MGIYTDLASTTPIPSKPRVGLDRASGEQLLSKASLHDPDLASAYAAADAVVSVGDEGTAATGDTYTLEFTFPTLGLTVTTGAIAYDDNSAAIVTDIDTAFTTASFPGWINGDISVTGGDIATAPVVLTLDGASVTETPVTVDLAATGFTYGGTITNSTPGTGGRKALQALYELNVISGTVNDPTVAPTDWAKPATNGQSRPRTKLIRDLCIQAAAEDGADHVYDAVVALYPEVAKS